MGWTPHPRRVWTWTTMNGPMPFLAYFGGTSFRIMPICETHEVGLTTALRCSECEPDRVSYELATHTLTYPLDRVSKKESLTIAGQARPFFEQFGQHEDVLMGTLVSSDTARDLGKMFWALHPWASPYLHGERGQGQDQLKQFMSVSAYRTRLWNELMTVWPHGLQRVGDRDFINVIEGLLQ